MILRPFFRQDMKRVGSIAFSAASQFYIAHAAERLFLHKPTGKAPTGFPREQDPSPPCAAAQQPESAAPHRGTAAGKFLRNVKMPQMNGLRCRQTPPNVSRSHLSGRPGKLNGRILFFWRNRTNFEPITCTTSKRWRSRSARRHPARRWGLSPAGPFFDKFPRFQRIIRLFDQSRRKAALPHHQHRIQIHGKRAQVSTLFACQHQNNLFLLFIAMFPQPFRKLAQRLAAVTDGILFGWAQFRICLFFHKENGIIAESIFPAR